MKLKKLKNENGECTPLFNIHCYSLGINSFSVFKTVGAKFSFGCTKICS